MRKIWGIVSILALVLLLGGCLNGGNTEPGGCTTTEGGETVDLSELVEPPELVVHYGQQSAALSSGNYDWTRPMADGTMQNVIACGLHPLDVEAAALLGSEDADEVRLEFTAPPDEITVEAWFDDGGLPVDGVDTESPLCQPAELTEEGFLPVDGAAVYGIMAVWHGFGSAEYALRVAWLPDVVHDGRIDTADWQQAAALGCTEEEFLAELQAEYNLTEGECESLLAGEISVLCGMSTRPAIMVEGEA